MKTSKLYSIILLITFILTVSCDDLLDINEDPSNPTSVPLNLLLPATNLDIGGALGTHTGGLSGGVTSAYVHHTVERGNQLNDYAIAQSNFRIITPWRSFYNRALTDLEEMIALGTEEEAWAYVGIAQILKAWSYHIIVDMWGTAPLTEAIQGANFPNPGYDDGEFIYDEMLVLLDTALVNLERISVQSPASDDLFYNGDISKWRKLAKTIKLKMYNQIRLVRDVSSEVSTLLAEDDLISSAADDFQLQYGGSSNPDNRNPGYAQEYAPAGQSYYVSPFIFEMMNGIDTFGHGNDLLDGITDPRIPYYWFNQLTTPGDDGQAQNPCSYCPSRTGTTFLSIWMFSFNIDPNEGFAQGNSQSVMGLYPLGGRYDDGNGGATNFNGVATTPQRLLTYYDRLFIEAELIQAGVTSGDARTTFEQAMRAAFAKVDEYASAGGAPTMDAQEVDDYINLILEAYDEGRQLEHIITQKWLANFGKSFDAYTDFRRTGFPQLHDGNTDNLNVTVRGREFTNALPYSDAEITSNANAPNQRALTDRVFWDPN